jgi:hypothetical protein
MKKDKYGDETMSFVFENEKETRTTDFVLGVARSKKISA